MPAEETLIKRTMPNSLEAEQSLIGSMIMDRDAIMVASELLVREDFYHQQYGILFEAMVELFNNREPVDLITLLMQYGMNSNKSTDVLSGNYLSFCLSCIVWLLALFLIVNLLLTRRDVKS